MRLGSDMAVVQSSSGTVSSSALWKIFFCGGALTSSTHEAGESVSVTSPAKISRRSADRTTTTTLTSRARVPPVYGLEV